MNQNVGTIVKIKDQELTFNKQAITKLFPRNYRQKNNSSSIFEFPDVDECLQHEDACGSNAGVCINLINQGFNCTCLPGYELSTNWTEGIVTCTDINECTEELHDCIHSPNLFCLNYPGAFVCG